MNGLGVTVAVLVTSTVLVVVTVDVTGRVINLALATSVVNVVVGLPSGPSRLARARASCMMPSRLRRRRAMRGRVVATAAWSALREMPTAVVQEVVGALVIVEVVVMVVTAWEVRRVERVVVIVDILWAVRFDLSAYRWWVHLRREGQSPFCGGR